MDVGGMDSRRQPQQDGEQEHQRERGAVDNQRFAREALEAGDLHRSLPKSVVLDDVLCIQGFQRSTKAIW